MKKILLICVMFACTMSVFSKEVTVAIGAGEHWKAKREPQCAVWLEDENGSFLQTLYVTERASKLNWIFSPKNGRPESLPVWYHASRNESVKKSKSQKKEAGLDAVTSATPKGGVTVTAQIPDAPCVIKAEFNTSFDYNDFYTKKTSGVNGQPSVIYAAKIPSEFVAGSEVHLEYSGYGSVDGTSGEIFTENKAFLTTALSIVKNVSVVGR